MEQFLNFLTEAWHVLWHTLEHTLPLLPFLFLTYLLMELLEHKAGDKIKGTLRKSGRFGPLLGGVLGAVPQCGFSAACAGFFSARVITPGTLVAVLLATSDEMIPVAIAGGAGPLFILKLLGIKVVCGIAVGLLVDLLAYRVFHRERVGEIEELCEQEGCHCEEKGVIRSSLHHTLKVALFLFLISLTLNTVIHLVGEDSLKTLFWDRPVLGPMIAAAVGLIPNCAASVVITELYLEGVISAGSLLAGLLSGAGIGILILFRMNHHRMKENFLVLGGVYAAGAVLGIIADLCNLGAIL